MTAARPAAVRLLPAGARAWLAGAVAVGLAQAVLLVAQADILARLLTGAFYGGISGRAVTGYCAAIASLALGQALFTWAWEACTEAAARRTRAAVRRWALAAAMDRVSPIGLAGTAGPSVPVGSGAGEPLGPGGVTTLIGSEIDELDPFVARVLPRTVLALAVPALLLAWIGHLDLVSAALAAATLVIAPVLAGLVGADTAAAVRRRLASLERLGDRFDALVEGLPLLRAFGRAADHERAVAASGEEVRTATLATLRIALLAGLVLELLAAVGTALVAVRLGLRLDAGQRILPQALAVLILLPEVFLPLRRLTADFHAGATGRAVLARLGGLTVDGAGLPAGRRRHPRPRAVAFLRGSVPRGRRPEPAGAGRDRPAGVPRGAGVPGRPERRRQDEPAPGGGGPRPAHGGPGAPGGPAARAGLGPAAPYRPARDRPGEHRARPAGCRRAHRPPGP